MPTISIYYYIDIPHLDIKMQVPRKNVDILKSGWTPVKWNILISKNIQITNTFFHLTAIFPRTFLPDNQFPLISFSDFHHLIFRFDFSSLGFCPSRLAYQSFCPSLFAYQSFCLSWLAYQSFCPSWLAYQILNTMCPQRGLVRFF